MRDGCSSSNKVRASLLLLVGIAGCGGREGSDAVVTRASALTLAATPAADTFINSASPDNNNGLSQSIYTGRNGQLGLMRGLVRFAMPAALQGRVTVGAVQLAMITRGLSATGTNPPTACTETLQAVSVPWTPGTGIGDAVAMNTVGDPCGSTGATWNQPNCVGSSWAGGTVSGSISGSAAVPAALEATVTWDSSSGGGGMVTDVQSWIDAPAGNQGWRITSSTEGGAGGMAQRFYSSEDATKGPRLSVTFACKAGFTDTGSGCTACTSAALASCVVAQGNVCNDPGAPATTYTCNCSNPAYAGTGTSACTDRNECAPNPCVANGDAAATCTDAVAPATGHQCSCSPGYVSNGSSCVGACGGGTDPCGNGGACTVAGGGWTCSCPAGFVSSGGVRSFCIDLNGCLTNGCTTGGDSAATCIDGVAPATGYSCACSPGYASTGGESPVCTAVAGGDAGPGDASAVDGGDASAVDGGDASAADGGDAGGSSGAAGIGGSGGGGRGGAGGHGTGGGGATGSAGVGGHAGSGGGGPGTGGSISAAHPGGSGCGCSVPLRGGSSGAAPVVLGLSALTCVVRRRRRSPGRR